MLICLLINEIYEKKKAVIVKEITVTSRVTEMAWRIKG